MGAAKVPATDASASTASTAAQTALLLRRTIGALAVAIATLSTTATWADGVDFIVMVDTSESMFASFDDVVGYILRDIVSRVEAGDTVHLLSFDTTPNIVFAEHLAESDQLRELIEHVLLLNPLGGYTDLVRATQFLSTYARSLPTTNDRSIVLLTDGIHDPPAGSATDTTFEDILAALLRSVEEIQQQGWSVRFLQLLDPVTDADAAATSGDAATSQSPERATTDPRRAGGGGDAVTSRDGAAPLLDALRGVLGEQAVVTLDGDAQRNEARGPSASANADAGTDADQGGAEDGGGGSASSGSGPVQAVRQALDRAIALPTLQIPADLGAVRRRLTLPITVTNHSNDALLIRLARVDVRGTSLLQGSPSATAAPGESVVIHARLLLGEDVAPGRHVLPAEFTFGQSLRVTPRRVDLSFTLREDGLISRAAVTGLLVAVAALVALVVLALLFYVLRNVLAVAGAAPVAHGAIEMCVTDQTRRNRLRNVHMLRPGQSASVGGGGSVFLIFLYPVPARIAELGFDGSSYRFVPLDSESLPNLPAPLEDCLGRRIQVHTRNHREVTVWFERYRSPLEEINALMRSITASPAATEPIAIDGSGA